MRTCVRMARPYRPIRELEAHLDRGELEFALALAPFEYQGHKINVLDVPGYADFVGDLNAALRVADLAVFVVSAVEGVEVQTEAAWRLAAQGPPEAGARFMARLQPVIDAIFKATRAEGRREPVEAYAFDALMRLAEGDEDLPRVVTTDG